MVGNNIKEILKVFYYTESCCKKSSVTAVTLKVSDMKF